MVKIKRAGRDDWSTVRDVRLAALRDTPDWFWSTYDEEVERPETWWREFIGVGAWFLAYSDDHPVGIAAALSAPELEDSERQVISMWVEPEARGQGIATRLLDAITGWAREMGVKGFSCK